MARRLSLAPAAIGLVLANAVSIATVIGSCLTATHAAEARDRALAELAETRGDWLRSVEASMRASIPKPRTWRLDRTLLLGALGVLGSALCTWRIVMASRKDPAAGQRSRSRSAFRARRRTPVDLPLSRSWW